MRAGLLRLVADHDRAAGARSTRACSASCSADARCRPDARPAARAPDDEDAGRRRIEGTGPRHRRIGRLVPRRQTRGRRSARAVGAAAGGRGPAAADAAEPAAGRSRLSPRNAADDARRRGSRGLRAARQAAAIEELLARIRAVPGVRAATYSNNGLFGGSDNGDEIIVEGYTPTGRDDRGSRYDAGRPGYFSTLGIPVRLGREITEEDRAGGRMVCVINETFAKRFFDGRNPIGLHVTQMYADDQPHV